MRRATMLLLLLLFATPASAQQPPAPDTTRAPVRHVIKTRDGLTFVGIIVDSTTDSLRLVTQSATVAIARSAILELRRAPAEAIVGGEYWPENPNTTRLFFAPTGRMLRQGEGYFSDTYLFFMNTVVGVTSRVTMGGGMSIFPLENFGDNLFYITPKLGVVQSEDVNVAVGALAGFLGGMSDEGTSATFGILYGVATKGSTNNNVTLGVGVPFAQGDFARNPLLMLGGEARMSRRTSFVTENYVLPGVEPGALVSYGLRFFGEKLSVDLAFINPLSEDAIFPGIPYVSFAVKF